MQWICKCSWQKSVDTSTALYSSGTYIKSNFLNIRFISKLSYLYSMLVVYKYSPQKIWECKIWLEISKLEQYISKIFYPQNIENMNSPDIFGHISPMTLQWYNKQMTLVQFVLWDINILTKMGSRIFCKMAKLVAMPKALNIIPRPGKKHVQKTKIRSLFLENGLYFDLGQIHLPLTDEPLVKCVWYKTIIFFIGM